MTPTRTITLTFDLAARTESELPTPDLLRERIQHDLDLHAVARADEHWITAISAPPQSADEDEAVEAARTAIAAAEAMPPQPPPNNSRCPACDNQIKGREIGYPRPLRRLKPHACPKCNATWYEVYEFAQVEMITAADPAPPQQEQERLRRQALQDLGIVGLKPGEEPDPLSEESIRKAAAGTGWELVPDPRDEGSGSL